MDVDAPILLPEADLYEELYIGKGVAYIIKFRTQEGRTNLEFHQQSQLQSVLHFNYCKIVRRRYKNESKFRIYIPRISK